MPVKERTPVAVILQLPSTARTDSNIRFHDDGISANAFKKLPCPVFRLNRMASCRGNPRSGIDRLHAGFAFPLSDLIRGNARGNMEIGSQPCVLLQPVFIVGFQPVNLSILKGKERHCPEDLIIILQGGNTIILRQTGSERWVERVILLIPDPQHPHAQLIQTVAELPVCLGKVWRNKNKIHLPSSPALASITAKV